MAGMGSRDIKRKIKSVNSTMQITNAMKMVSTSKRKKNRDRVDVTKPYFETVLETVRDIVSTQKNIRHDYLEERLVRKTLYIVITSDRGLCGGYNTNVIKQVLGDNIESHKVMFIPIGKMIHGKNRINNFIIYQFHACILQ